MAVRLRHRLNYEDFYPEIQKSAAAQPIGLLISAELGARHYSLVMIQQVVRQQQVVMLGQI